MPKSRSARKISTSHASRNTKSEHTHYSLSAYKSHKLPQHNGVFTRSSKRPANFQQMYSKYTLDVCWTFAGSYKHPIIVANSAQELLSWRQLYTELLLELLPGSEKALLSFAFNRSK